MADRTVSVRLTADPKAFIAGMAAAEAAARRLRDSLRDGLGDPFKNMPKEVPLPRLPKDTPSRMPREGSEAAGAFARGFAQRMETAFRALPKVRLDADSTPAQTKLQEVRDELRELAGKTIGIDIDAGTALTKVATLRRALEQLENTADVNVRADVGAALAQMDALQREVDRLNGVRPTVRPEVAIAEAQRKLADLRARLDELRSRRVGIDIDAGAAQAELSAIQRDLQRLNASAPTVQIRVDSTAALAEISAMQAATDRLDGRRANVSVTADVGGALMAIGMVSAALAALPSVATITVGVGALGAAFTSAGMAAGGFAAVAVPGLGRVNEALRQQESAAGGAGGAVESLAAKQARAAATALQLAEAQDRVKQAQRGVQDAIAGVARAQQDAARAAEQAADRQAAAARRIEQAERAVQDAHRATQRAIEDLTRARERAQQRLEDLALATEGGALAEERAQLALERARQEAARIEANQGSSVLDRQDAALRVREAEFALKEIRARNQRLAREAADAAAKGVEGSDEVRAAKEAIEAATRREQDAERDLAEARRDAARAAVDGQRAIAAAHERVADAQRRVADAQQQLLRAQQRLKVEQLQAKAAMERTGAAAGGAASAMAELTAEEAKLAQKIKDFKEVYEDWQESLQKPAFGVLIKGLDAIEAGLPRLTPLVLGASDGFSTLLDELTAALTSPYWTQWFDAMGREAPRVIEGLGRASGNVVTGFAGIMQAFLPTSRGFLDWLVEVTARFAEWGKNLEDNPGFKRFIAYVEENAPKVGKLLGDIAATAVNIVSALSGAGSGALDFLTGISERLRNLSSEQIQAIALGIGAVVAAAKLGATLKLGAWLVFADLISRMSPGQIQATAIAIAAVVTAVKGYQAIRGVTEWWGALGGGITRAGDAAGTARGKFAGLRDILTGGGGMALAVAGVATAVGQLDRKLSGLDPSIEGLARHLDEFARGGKPAADVLDQIQGKASLVDARGLQSIGDVVERMASANWWDQLDTQIGGFLNTIGGVVGLSFDHGAERIRNLDQALATMVSSGRADSAARMFEEITRQAREAGVPLDRLRDLFPQYTSAAANSVQPTKDVADAFGEAKTGIDGLSESMGVFTARTDYAQAVQALKDKYDDLTGAIKTANGTLDISKAKTDAQRDAVITARDRFADYIRSVEELANKQKDLTGNTDDARKVVLDQVGALLQLAGKSKDAQALVYGLAQKFGISKQEADKAKQGVKDVKEALDQLRDKTVKVIADTAEAINRIGQVKKDLQGIPQYVGVKVDTTYGGGKPLAEGGVVEYYATGGVRESHVAQIAPAGVMRVWAEPETGGEAYIPLAPSKRTRSLAILEEVARRFGHQVVPAPERGVTSKASATSAATSGRAVVEVDLTDLPELIDSTQYTARVIGGAVAEAGRETARATDDLASAAESTISGLSRQMATLGASIDRLASSVDGLASSVSAAASAAASAVSAAGSVGVVAISSSKAATSSKATSTKKPGLIEPAGPKSAGGLIEPSAPTLPAIQLLADGGLVTSPTVMVGEAGREMVIPLSPSRRGRGLQTLQQAAAMMGQEVVPARPRYVSGSGQGQFTVQIDERFIRRLEAVVKEARGVSVQVTTHNPVAEPASTTTNKALQLAASVGMV